MGKHFVNRFRCRQIINSSRISTNDEVDLVLGGEIEILESMNLMSRPAIPIRLIRQLFLVLFRLAR